MRALPNAKSRGLTTGGGGGPLALTGISAARAEPDIIPSAVAAKTTFFMTIPITFQKTSRLPDAPRDGLVVNWLQSGTRRICREAKNASICRLFRRLRDSTKGCWSVLHSDNILPGLDRRICPPTSEEHASKRGRESVFPNARHGPPKLDSHRKGHGSFKPRPSQLPVMCARLVVVLAVARMPPGRGRARCRPAWRGGRLGLMRRCRFG